LILMGARLGDLYIMTIDIRHRPKPRLCTAHSRH
jgi:hypothetical protein